jgi:phosphatidylserine/phosphatidylglycerophosphate/cardiolipin synthase-like enzyme
VILVLPEKTGRVLDCVRAADKHHRQRVYCLSRPDLADIFISAHAKLLIVDQRLLCIRSSNASNHLVGLDTECDPAIESLHSPPVLTP